MMSEDIQYFNLEFQAQSMKGGYVKWSRAAEDGAGLDVLKIEPRGHGDDKEGGRRL